MKKQNIILTFILIGLLLTVGCCKDEKCKKGKKDYREEWVGIYDCEEIYDLWRHAPDSPTGGIYSTEIYQTKVNVTAIDDSSLNLLESRTGRSYEMKVNINGYFLKPKTSSSDWGIYGNFISDSIYMSINPGHSLGRRMHSDYKGKKLKNK
jgi:hypothetical protein